MTKTQTKKQPKKPQKILFLYANAGSGHKTASQKISQAFTKKYPNQTIAIQKDVFSDSSKFARWFFDKGYTWPVNNARIPYYATIFWFANFKILTRLFVFISSLTSNKYLTKFIQKTKPDKIVLTYFWGQPTHKILKKLKLNIPVFNIVTENFSPPKFWFLEKKSEHIVFSQQAKKLALKEKIPTNKIKILKVLMDEKFTKKMSKTEQQKFKNQLGINNTKKTILLFGGGVGLPKGAKILNQLLKNEVDANIILICGHNQKVAKQAKKIVKKWKKENPTNRDNIKIFGFVDFIYELINIADIVVGKGGCLSTTEILSLQKPLIINDYIWPQETGNKDFVVQKKIGFYEPNPKKLAKKITTLLKNPGELFLMNKRIKKLNWQSETEKFVEEVLKYKV